MVEWILRGANRRLGRGLDRIEWLGSFESYIRYTADRMVEGWTVDDEYPVAAPDGYWHSAGSSSSALESLTRIDDLMWESERAAHRTARLTPSQRLPVYLNAITKPALASRLAGVALSAASTAARTPAARARLRRR